MKYLLVLLSTVVLLLTACNGPDTRGELQKHYTEVAANAVHWQDYHTAATAWQNLYALDKTNAPLLDSIFGAYMLTANYPAAAALGTDLYRAHSKDENFMARLVLAYKEAGNFQASIDAARVHVTLTTDTVPDYYNMGLCFLELKNYPNTVGYMSRVLADTVALHRLVNVKGQNVPYYAAALNVIGIAEIKQGNFENGRKALSKALQLAPNFTSAVNNMNLLRAMGH